LRLMCRQVAQTVAKNPETKWLEALPFLKEQAADKTPAWIVGYCAEHRAAYRMKLDGRDKELAEETLMPSERDGNELAIAKFADGTEHDIPSMTIAQYAKIKEAQIAPCGKRELFWEQAHNLTKHKLHVAKRADRQLLISLFEQCRQVLQVRVDLFGPEDELESQIKVFKFMKDIGVKYAASALSSTSLKTYRDSEIPRLGLARRTPKIRKAADNMGYETTEGVTPPMKKPAKAGNDKEEDEGDTTTTSTPSKEAATP